MRGRKKFTYANVMSTIAVLLAIGGGTAFAALELGKNTVKSRNIAPGAVRTPDIKNRAVKRAKIAPGAIDSSRLAGGAVDSGKLAEGAVTAGKIAGEAIEEGKLAPSLKAKLNATQTGGIIRVDAAGTSLSDSPERTLLSRGPFRIYAKCFNSGPNVAAQIFLASTVPGTIATGATTQFRGGLNNAYLDPSTPEISRRMASVSTGPAATTQIAGAATLVNGSNSISASVIGWIKGSTAASDSANYGAGATAKCLFVPYLVAASG
ncbi:MAG: hypothetical protein U0R29_08000 [Solirubrobacterales bacterium]